MLNKVLKFSFLLVFVGLLNACTGSTFYHENIMRVRLSVLIMTSWLYVLAVRMALGKDKSSKYIVMSGKVLSRKVMMIIGSIMLGPYRLNL